MTIGEALLPLAAAAQFKQWLIKQGALDYRRIEVSPTIAYVELPEPVEPVWSWENAPLEFFPFQTYSIKLGKLASSIPPMHYFLRIALNPEHEVLAWSEVAVNAVLERGHEYKDFWNKSFDRESGEWIND